MLEMIHQKVSMPDECKVKVPILIFRYAHKLAMLPVTAKGSMFFVGGGGDLDLAVTTVMYHTNLVRLRNSFIVLTT